eukprot:Rmarinus@m.8093
MGGGASKKLSQFMPHNLYAAFSRPQSPVFEDGVFDSLKLNKEVPVLEESERVKLLPRGGVVVLTKAGPIQFGIPPETIKDTMKTNFKVPTMFVVPDEPFNKKVRLNLAEFEFPAYFNFFVLGKPVTLICPKDLEERIRTVFTVTLLGPSDNREREDYSALLGDEHVPDCRAEGDFIRKSSWVEGKPIGIDALLAFKIFDRKECAVKIDPSGDVVLIRNPKKHVYILREKGQRDLHISMDVHLPSVVEVPRYPSFRFEPPLFGVTMLGTSHGFDPNGKTTGFIAWINHQGIMVDPPPFSGNVLAASGIPARLIHAVVLTHCHADHDAGTFQKILEEQRIQVITTPTIIRCFLKKYSAISGLEVDFLKKFFEFKPVRIGESFRVFGGHMDFFYALHTIPCLGFSAHFGGKSFAFSGDTCLDEDIIHAMHSAHVINDIRKKQLLDFPWHCDVVLHEAGVPPIHTPIRTLEALPAHIKSRLYLVHASESIIQHRKNLKIAREGPENTIRIAADPPDFAQAIKFLKLLDHVDFFSSLTVAEAHELLQIIRLRQYEAGSSIVRYGTMGDCMYVLASGVVYVDAKVLVKRYSTPGDYFGETSLCENKPRNADIVAETNVELIEIPKQPFLAIVKRTDIIARLLHLAAVRRQSSWQVISRNSVLGRLTSRQKTRLQEIVEARHFRGGDIVWDKGVQAAEAVLVESGEFEYENLPNHSFGRGTFVGDVTKLMQSAAHRTRLVAKSPGTLFMITAKDLLDFFERNPGVQLSLMDTFFVAAGNEEPPEESLRIEAPSHDLPHRDVADVLTAQVHPTRNSRDLLINLILSMYDHLDVVRPLALPVHKLKVFLLRAAERYRFNPYHSFTHAAYVTQRLFSYIHTLSGYLPFTPLEKFALLTAGLCHDVDHPGLTDQQLIARKSSLAVLYNNISVLEMHHCATLFELMKDTQCNVVYNLSAADWCQFRKLSIDLILSTELSKHQTHLSALNDIKASFNPKDANHRLIAMKLLLKSADVSIIVDEWEIFEPWAEALQLEVYAADRNVTPERFAVCQYKFMLSMKPLYDTLASLFGDVFTQASQALTANTEQWRQKYVSDTVYAYDEPCVLATVAC